MKTKRECPPPLSERLKDVKQGQNKEGKTVLYLVFEYMDTNLKKYIWIFRQTGGHIPPETVKNLGDNDVISIIIESLGEKVIFSDMRGRVGLTGEILWDMEEMKPPEHWQGVWKQVVVVGGGVAGSLVAKSLQFHADVNLIVPNSVVNKSEYSIEWGELVPGSEINRTMMIAHTEELVEDIVKVGVQNGWILTL